MKALSELSGLHIEAVPEPIMAGAVGAAMRVLRASGSHAGIQEMST